MLRRAPARVANLLVALIAVISVGACSNSTPELKQQSGAPQLTGNHIVIQSLDANANVTGTCDNLGKQDKGFALSFSSISDWVMQSSVTCTDGVFTTRVEKLGRSMQFTEFKKETKKLRMRRFSITGKTTETEITVEYAPNLMPGGFAEGGGVAIAGGKFIVRGSFSGSQKETGVTLTSHDAKFKAVLSRDRL